MALPEKIAFVRPYATATACVQALAGQSVLLLKASVQQISGVYNTPDGNNQTVNTTGMN
jgi:hypothetical protein